MEQSRPKPSTLRTDVPSSQHNRIQVLDAENNRRKEDEQEKQEPLEEQAKPKPKGKKSKRAEKTALF